MSRGRLSLVSEHSECFSIVVSEDQTAVRWPFLWPLLSPGDTRAPLSLPHPQNTVPAACGALWAGGRSRGAFLFSPPSLFLLGCRQPECLLGSPHPQMKKTEGRLFLKKDRCKLGFSRLRHKCEDFRMQWDTGPVGRREGFSAKARIPFVEAE